jgi:arylsulfatase A-like enzyme
MDRATEKPQFFSFRAVVISVIFIVAPLFPQTQPNIIFIMVDDLGKEWIAAYGGEGIQTPHIDAMAENGMKFLNAYSMPKCTPTRASLLTGLYPYNNGWVNHWDVPRWSLPSSEGGRGGDAHFDWKYNMTFARIMKSAGYVTAAAGKWQINDFRTHPDAMVRHGFDEYAMWTGFETGNPPSANRYWDAYIHHDGESRAYTDQFGADVFVDFIIDFMGRNVDRPQMIYFPMCLTHTPFTTTPHDLNASTNMQKHRAMVRYTDYSVGRLIDATDSLGIASRTIFIFTTDNGTVGSITGTLDGRTVQGSKGKMNEAGTCEPFIAYGPGLVPAGVETDLLTDFTDMLPTFAELAGINPDSLYKYYPIDGHSIAKTLLGEEPDFERERILSMGGGEAILGDSGIEPAKTYAARVLRDKQYKVWVNDAGVITQIYDLPADPVESNNLINSSDPGVLAALEKFRAILGTFPATDARPIYDSALFVPFPDTVPDPGTLDLMPVMVRKPDQPSGHIFQLDHQVIRFQLHSPAYVSLAVTDVSGKRVRTLIDNMLSPGEHNIVWDRDDFSNGIYVLEFRAGNVSQRRMMFRMD